MVDELRTNLSTMSIKIIRLGSARGKNEGLRIGTVRRPPRGVAKADFARKDWYDVWFPNLAPSADIIKYGLNAETEKQWHAFAQKFRREMQEPGPRHDIELLASLSHSANLSVGCYCEREARCYRSILRQLLIEEGAMVETLEGV